MNADSSNAVNKRTRILRSLALMAVVSLASGTALAQGIAARVTAEPGSATHSTAVTTNKAGYRVDLSNTTSSTLNLGKFIASTSVAGGDGSSAPFATPAFVLSSSNATTKCTLTTATSVSCDVGTVNPGGSVTFYLVVNTPTAGTAISLNWVSGYGMGPGNSSSGTATTVLEAVNDSKVSGFVAGTFALLATATTPTPTDRMVSSLRVDPAANAGIQASVFERETNGTYAWDVSVTRSDGTKASVGDGLSDYLQITLKRDASTVKGSIKNAVIVYYYLTESGVESSWTLLSCDQMSGGVPVKDKPCIQDRAEYTRKQALALGDPELVGDWVFIILAFDNGRFEM